MRGGWRGGRDPADVIPELVRKAILERSWKAMQKVIDQAVEDAKRYTASRPGKKSGKAGRIDSGEMISQIMGNVIRDGMDRIVGEFGFLNRKELYFLLQTDSGFMNGTEYIEPTYALRDAMTRALTVLEEEMTQ